MGVCVCVSASVRVYAGASLYCNAKNQIVCMIRRSVRVNMKINVRSKSYL